MATTVSDISKPRLAQKLILRSIHYDRRHQFVVTVVLSFLCFATLLPFIWVALTAFKPDTEIYTTNLQIFPQEWTLAQFQKVLTKGSDLPIYMLNTLFYSAVTISVVVVFSSMGGYALGLLTFRGANIIVTGLLIILSIPWIILIVPLLMFEFQLQIWNTRTGLILPYIALFLPVAIWIMRGSFMGMPKELGEAARIDGASEFIVFWRVYLPMTRGGIATVILLTFVDIWNEVLLAASLANNPKIANINIGLRRLAEEGQSFAFGPLSVTILIAMIPTFVVFLVLQRYYVRGISEGALAGF
jgi:ABC-type glycerol-3-phosphate transport system permease component